MIDNHSDQMIGCDDDDADDAIDWTDFLDSIQARREEARGKAATFLGAVFNAGGDSKTLGTVIVAKKLQHGFAHYSHESIAEAANEAARISAARDEAYFAPALFKDFDPTATKNNRVSEKAMGACAFWLDLDVGDTKAQEGKGYATQQEALEALRDFCAATGLPRPSPVISSGYGVHVYWLMSEFVPRGRWLEAARMLKALTIAHKLLVDQSRTADIASVLRPVGTRNFKNPAMPQTVATLHPRDGALPRRVDLAKFEALLDAAVHALPHADERGRRILAARDAAAGTTSSTTSGPQAPPPETPEEIARIQSMLNAIDPDVDRETWLKACWGALATRWDCAEGLIRKWSERGKKFDETDFAKVVASFDPTRGIGVGTLYYIARQHDWQEPATTKGKSDIANGRRFAKTFRNKLLWIADLGDWFIFDPQTGWRDAPPGEAERAAKAIVDEMGAEAGTKEVLRSSQAKNVRAMIDMAKSEPGMFARLSEFDSDPMVIGLQNCIFNLDRWEYEPPTPERKVSKRANVVFDPDARCPGFLKFLKEVQPDPEVRRLLRAWYGYCLTGRTNEAVFLYLHGDGSNGKSTFIELIAWVFGNYARKIPTEMLMSHKRNPQGASPDIMLLKGLRLAFANETEDGERLAEARIKDLTGGDTLTGRATYAKEFTNFQPTHKLTIAGNYKAEVRDNSHGMWRRMTLVPFNVTITEENDDRSLTETLKAEGAGILNWLLRGLRDYQANGLNVPQAIRAATAAYRTEQDLVGEWIADDCVTGAGMHEDKSTLYSDYAFWAKANGYMPVGRARLTRQLTGRGFQLDPGRRKILGLALKRSGIGGVRSMTAPITVPSAPSASVMSTLEAELAEAAKVVDINSKKKR